MKRLLILVAALLLLSSCGDNLLPLGHDAMVKVEGDTCGTDGECADICLEQLADGKRVQPGVCTSTCENSSDCLGECLYYYVTGESFCFASCATQDDCHPNHNCIAELGACVPNLY